MKGTVYGVSLGPGDPELVTLKALHVLQQVDVVFCPGTKLRSGEVKSRSGDILRALPVDEGKVRVFAVPMSKDRTSALGAYEALCREVEALVAGGKSVAITAEGDACFYSSANYLYGLLREAGCRVEMVAGVPAFIAAASSVGLHLVKQRERLLVIPGDVVVEELLESVVSKRVLVIMKVPLGEGILRPFLARHTELHYHYFEQVGTPDEFYTSDLQEILARDFTYFSILVISAH